MPVVGPINCITDIEGIEVGHAHDSSLKSGVSVITSSTGFTASYSVMGGAPGTRDTDLLEPDKTVQLVDAFVLSGGSAFGLDAATGVSDALRKDGRGFEVGPHRVPIVPSAIVFDLMNGGRKDWDISPYNALGRQAYQNRLRQSDNGTIGAGYGAIAGQLKGGLGTASFRLDSGITVAALIVANPVGAVITPDNRHFWAAPFEMHDEFGGFGSSHSLGSGLDFRQTKMAHLIEGANTTIGVVLTDASLSKSQCKRLATSSHDGMARAIVPSHLPHDGDLLFAGSTSEKSNEVTPILMAEICHFASLCVARAIARGVYNATPFDNDVVPTFSQTRAD